MGVEILTVGHSNLDYGTFLSSLRHAGVTALADVRSVPFSQRFPQFSRPALQAALKADGVAYSFLGAELGGRPADPAHYRDGVADYEPMAAAPAFASGLDRVMAGAARYRVALLCSEKHPVDCHRCLLVGRALKCRDACVSHILCEGVTVTQDEVEEGLLREAGLDREDMFAPLDARLATAYRKRASRVAHAKV